MKSRLLGAVSACVFTFVALSANAALIGVLPATAGGTDWQAYYDDQLDITWTANANINGAGYWNNQVAWAAGLDINGVTGWRLPNMDVNGDGSIISCIYLDQTACKDNEYGHLLSFGAGTVFGGGITSSSPGPFSNVQPNDYWSGTGYAPDPLLAWGFNFIGGGQVQIFKNSSLFAWAVHSGKVNADPVPPVVTPVPAAVWLFGSGLIGLLGLTKRKKA